MIPIEASQKETLRPMPEKTASLAYSATFSKSEFAFISRGFSPSRVDDRWIARFSETTLSLHRKDSGICVYRVRFGRSGKGFRVIEASANREEGEYAHTDAGYDARILHYLIRSLLLGERLPFPECPPATIAPLPSPSSPPPAPWWKVW